jgi:hypothetical protein
MCEACVAPKWFLLEGPFAVSLTGLREVTIWLREVDDIRVRLLAEHNKFDFGVRRWLLATLPGKHPGLVAGSIRRVVDVCNTDVEIWARGMLGTLGGGRLVCSHYYTAAL